MCSRGCERHESEESMSCTLWRSVSPLSALTILRAFLSVALHGKLVLGTPEREGCRQRAGRRAGGTALPPLWQLQLLSSSRQDLMLQREPRSATQSGQSRPWIGRPLGLHSRSCGARSIAAVLGAAGRYRDTQPSLCVWVCTCL